MNNPTCLLGNGAYDLYNDLGFNNQYTIDGHGNVDARNVWWGTENPVEISAHIYDYMDNSKNGIVFYDPWATIPEPATLALLTAGYFVVFRRRRC